MRWTEICVHTSHEASEITSFYLQELGAEGIALEDATVLSVDWTQGYGEIVELNPDDYPEEGVRIKAYLPETMDLNTVLETIERKLQELSNYGIDPSPGKITTRSIEEESWSHAWKKYYKPVQVTKKITIQPVWEEYTPREDELIIRLDPGMAFGTGTHPTTILCLQLLEKYLKPNDRVIDVGCGSGILSIAAAKLGAASVLARDLDPIAVKSTRKNVTLNGLEETIECEEGDLLKGTTKLAEVIVSNILAEIIVQFMHELPRVLVPGGIFIASGIIEEKKELVCQSLRKMGMEVVEMIHQEGWVAIVAKKW